MILRIRPTDSFLTAWAILFFMISSGWGQTTLTTSDSFGHTVVIVETTDVNGVPVGTTVITTLSRATATSTSTTTTTNEGDGGPIGYTTSEGQVGPTTYIYTTTDQYGSKTVVTDVFTPTYEPTSPWPSVPAGTIPNYSAYMSSKPQGANGAYKRVPGLLQVSTTAVVAALSTVLCVATGALLINL